jgi:DnaA N-terminal domain
MAWIELHQSLWTHRKVLALAEELDLDPLLAAAHMARLWCWAIDNAPDGDLGNIGIRTVALAAAYTGTPHHFHTAMQTAGFLDNTRLHDWDDYAGRLIEGRRRHAEYMRRKRSAQTGQVTTPDPAQTEHTTVPPPARETHVSSTDRARSALPNRTGPDHTVQHQTVPKPDGVSRPHAWVAEILPGALDNPADAETIALLLATYPDVDHEYEMRKLRLKRRRPRRGWVADYVSWLTDGVSVRYLDGSDDKLGRPPMADPDPLPDLDPTDIPIWEQVRERLIESMGRPNYSRWFGQSVVTLEGSALTIALPTEFEREWIEKKLPNYVPQALRDIEESEITITYAAQEGRARQA